jgi:hypothetical protein
VAGDRLSKEQRAQAIEIFEGRTRDLKGEPRHGCYHCTAIHDVVDGLPPYRQPCPRIKKATWTLDGTLLEVEYWPRGQWEDDDMIFPRDAYDDDDDEDEETSDATR